MLTFYTAADSLIAEQDQFEKDIAEFVDGQINPIKFKAIRVAHGVYEQRERDTYMIRIRCAAGGITPAQLKKVAELGDKYGSGEVHFTTRQEVQVHNVLIHNLMNVIRGLNEVNLSSRGGGGNTIRNILTSPDSGVDPETVFDVDPYAVALTTRLIQEDDSWNLPRKFKIAMSHNNKDTAYTQATCLGFVAKMKDGQRGFIVHCSGGMGAKPMMGHELIDWIPDTRVYHVARAIKTMFDANGNRRSKFSSRIKFLWKKLGDDDFKKLFHEYYDEIKDDDSLILELPTLENKTNDTINLEPIEAKGDDYESWKARYVFEQIQDGLKSIKLPLSLGDLLRADADKLCDFLSEIGENTIRCDRAQNMRIRNIPEKYLGNLFTVIQSMEMTLADLPEFVGNMINCTGAQTCKLGICLPRGLSDAIRERLVRTDLDLDSISDFQVNMSGCPNTCGMHHVADLGFFGKIGRKDGEIYPAYNVLSGAKTGVAGQMEYAKRVDEISSKNIPDFLAGFLSQWIEKKPIYSDYHEFLAAEGNELIKTLCNQYREVPSYKDNPGHYHDWGRDRQMTLDDMGAAECSAGMFDMIDVDKKQIENNVKSLDEADTNVEDALYNICFHASRMLLVTRGLESKNETQAITLFLKHFVTTELVDPSFGDALTLAKLGVKAELVNHKDKIVELGQAVQDLYKNMDDSLRFNVEKKSDDTSSAPTVDHKLKDFRGVACPMNFVKTKLALETISSGQKLEVLLDNGEPIENVPNSVSGEGHKVIQKNQAEDGHWSVIIEKA